MKSKLSLGLFAVAFSIVSSTALAQDFDYHPALSDNFDASVGWFRSDNTFKIEANGVDFEPNREIDFGNQLGVDQTNSLLNLQLRWKFGNEGKWSLWGQYFKNSASGEAVLEEDVEWRDVIFHEGSFVGAGVSMEINRLFFGRSFVKNEQNDFGVGLGVHNLKLGANIEGEILLDEGGTGFHRSDASKSQLLPNVGAWYLYSPAKKWLLHTRLDWISAKIGDIDGTMWNTNVGVNYQAFRHVGFDLSYQYFNLNVGVDSTDWNGGVDMTYSGPMISLTGNW